MNGVRVLTQSNRRLDQQDPDSLLADINAKEEEIESLLREAERAQHDDQQAGGVGGAERDRRYVAST